MSETEYKKAVRIDDEEETPKRRVDKTKTKTKKKKKRKAKKHSWFLAIALVIAAIPCIAVLVILLQAMKETGKPINGKRFDNDLNPAITETIENSILKGVEQIEGVQKVDIDTRVATLRVNVDYDENLSKEDAITLGNKIVEVINTYAPIDTYFTSYGVSKMYDFEINLYDVKGDNVSPNVYIVIGKNGANAEITTQVMTDPVNPEKVQALEEKRKAEEEAKKQEQASNDAQDNTDTTDTTDKKE